MGDFPGLLPLTFQPADNLGESVSAWVRHRFPRDTAKKLAQFADLDPKTAQNIVIARHVSAPSLTKMVRAFGWPFLMDVGSALLRETHDEWVNREIEDIANAQAQLQAMEAALRTRREAARALRSLAPSGLCLVPETDAHARGAEHGEAGGLGLRPHPR